MTIAPCFLRAAAIFFTVESMARSYVAKTAAGVPSRDPRLPLVMLKLALAFSLVELFDLALFPAAH